MDMPCQILERAAIQIARQKGWDQPETRVTASVRNEKGYEIAVTTGIQESDLEETGIDLKLKDLPPMAAGNEHWKWLTDDEKAIIRIASTSEWQPAAKLSELSGVPRDRDFDSLLRFMCNRDILESAHGKGYRLKNPPQTPI